MSICFRPRRLRRCPRACQVIQARAGSLKNARSRSVANGTRRKPTGRSRLRVVGSERLKKGVRFVPYVFHEGLVLLRILTRGLEVSPQALDEDQALASIVQGGLVSHGSAAVCAEIHEWESRFLAYIPGNTFTS